MDMTRVWQYIDDHKDEYLDLLKKFVSQPSVSATGEGIMEMAELLRETQSALGAESELVECLKYPIVAGKIDNGAPRTIMIYNHYDVVPAEPLEKWSTPPFTPVEKDGKLFGRGVADNKGSLLSRYCAIDAFQKVYGRLPVNIQFLAEGAEEIGSPGLPEFIASHPDKVRADGIIWEGGSRGINGGPLQVTFGIKGICYVELRCRGAKADIHSSYASIIESPAWRLVWALGTLKSRDEVITIEGFNELSVPPGPRDLDYMAQMVYDEKGTLESFGADRFLNNLTGMDLKSKFLFQPALNICGIECGYTGEGSKTVLPNYAAAKLDFRLCVGQEPGQVLELLRKHLDNHGFEDIEIINYNNTVPYRGDPDSLIGKAILQNVERVYGIPPVVQTSLAGSSGMGTFCKLTGIPAVCIGVYNDDSQCHAPNEYIFVDDFIKGIKLSACVLHDFAEVE